MHSTSVPPSSKSLQIIEAFDHFELIYRWLDILTQLPFSVTFHLNQAYRKELENRYSQLNQVQFYSPQTRQSWPDYLRQLTDDPDYVWVISTIGRRPSWFSPLFSFHSLFVVEHDLNYCNSIRFRPKKIHDPFSVIRGLATIPWQSSQRQLMDTAKGYIYPTPALREYGRLHNKRPNKIHLTIPFAGQADSTLQQTSTSGNFRIVVPGSVRGSVRDYALLTEALDHALIQDGRLMEVHFAGPVMDPTIAAQFTDFARKVNRSASYKSRLQEFFYFQGLPFTDYEDLIASADLLVSPLRPYARISNVWEELGKTKISGSVFDAIRFGKRLYVPAWFDPQFTELFRFRSAQDLGEQLLQAAKAPPLAPVTYAGYGTEQIKSYWLALFYP